MADYATLIRPTWFGRSSAPVASAHSSSAAPAPRASPQQLRVTEHHRPTRAMRQPDTIQPPHITRLTGINPLAVTGQHMHRAHQARLLQRAQLREHRLQTAIPQHPPAVIPYLRQYGGLPGRRPQLRRIAARARRRRRRLHVRRSITLKYCHCGQRHRGSNHTGHTATQLFRLHASSLSGHRLWRVGTLSSAATPAIHDVHQAFPAGPHGKRTRRTSHSWR